MRILYFLTCWMLFILVPLLSLAQTDKPNILVILVDDLGYGDLSCQGTSDIQTPHIDKLMDEGVKLTEFYANCPVCSPTRASLLTGRYPDLVGVPGVIREESVGNWGYFQPDGPTLPMMLNQAGYNTGMVGKWHLGLESPNTPNERGFEFFNGFLGDMMDDYYTHLRHENNYMRLNKEIVNPEGHATDVFTSWAIDFLNKQKKIKKPFFLYLAYNAPHDPIQPPDDWLKKVKKREKGMTDKRAGLVALIEHLDHGIGEVIDALKASNQYDNTVIVFTSDNGGALRFGANNGNLRGGKQNMFEGGLKVPACVVWKDKLISGSQSDQIGITMDLYPTLCEIAGINVSHEIDGMSLWPVLNGDEQQTVTDRTLFWVRREGWAYNGLAYYAARIGNMKLVQNTPFEEFLFFDVGNDPTEKDSIQGNSDINKRLRFQLQEHIRKSGSIPFQPPK